MVGFLLHTVNNLIGFASAIEAHSFVVASYSLLFLAGNSSCTSCKYFQTVRYMHHSFVFSGQKATASMERDENYVPYTRSQFKLPDEKSSKKTDYDELFEETPVYTMYRLFIMQAL